jgi:hypothetical protein
MNISTNQKAPVFCKDQIEIKASLDKVWKALTQIKKWQEWQPEIQKIDVPDILGENITFRWKANGFNITSTIHTLNKSKMLLGWTGKTIGTSAVHNWRIQNGKNSVTVFVEESLAGILPFLLKKKLQAELVVSMRKSLQNLKEYCEKKIKI